MPFINAFGGEFGKIMSDHHGGRHTGEIAHGGSHPGTADGHEAPSGQTISSLPAPPRRTPTSGATEHAAKRGDLAVFVHQSTSSYINGPNQTRTRITVGEVTSAKRDGGIGAFRDLQGFAARKLENSELEHAQRYIIPAGEIDKAGVENLVRSRGLLSDSGNYDPFNSIDEVRAALKPYRTHGGNQ